MEERLIHGIEGALLVAAKEIDNLIEYFFVRQSAAIESLRVMSLNDVHREAILASEGLSGAAGYDAIRRPRW